MSCITICEERSFLKDERTWQASCTTCGWQGEHRAMRSTAEVDGEYHAEECGA